VRRQFPPGSEWLYAKLYTGPGIADRLLVDTIRPLVSTAVACGAADGWFFIRYTDPDPHVRLRLHGDPLRLTGELLPRLADSLAPLVEDGRVARRQLDTYVREVERDGGAQGIVLAEQLFCLDSECVLAMLDSTPGDEGLAWRWKLATCGVDRLLDALGLDLNDKCDWARQQRDAFGHGFRVDGHLEQQLGDKFRAERSDLRDLWQLARSPAAAQYPALEATSALESVAAAPGDRDDAGPRRDDARAGRDDARAGRHRDNARAGQIAAGDPPQVAVCQLTQRFLLERELE
jgi:thiopeptide-type bacteriocin biosynthesis protein